jgi:mono/diheme cytochrome c family protein
MRTTARTIPVIAAAVLLLALGGAMTSAPRAQENDVPIYAGVFSTEQVARGKTAFEANCARCHRANLEGTERGPSLKGDNFWGHWENETVATLFVKVRDQMPPNFTGAELDPQTKLDIVSYLLSANEFPTGRGEMKPDREALDELQIVKKGAAASMPNFAIVQVVGCLAKGTGESWTLTHAGKPAKQASPFPAKVAAVGDRPLGSDTFLLTSMKGFGPEEQAGHKVEAVGLIYRAPGDNRLDVTSLRSLGPSCGS